MIKEIDSRISRALGRIRLAFRGVGSLVNSGAPVQLFQGEGLSGEQLQDNELMQHYGFTSRPPAGFMYVAIPIGGKTAHSIAVATEHADYRLKGLKSGEMAIYTDEGDSIVLKRGRLIEVTTQTLRINAGTLVEINTPKMQVNASALMGITTEKVQMTAPLVATTGQIRADLDITDMVPDGGRSMAAMREIFDIHDHDENDAGGPTNSPNQQI